MYGHGGGRGYMGPPRDRVFSRGRGRDRDAPPRAPLPNLTGVSFRSYEEERAWVEDRRRKRLARPSKFDITPDSSMNQGTITGIDGVAGAGNLPTRHARRLYFGDLSPLTTEEMLEQTIIGAIQTCIEGEAPEENLILNVYINKEKLYAFVEFKTVEMTTACTELDGIHIAGKPVKVKRPNDYNQALAPAIHPSAMPRLDVSKLGIISRVVLDGPNKIFIGGLHHHLTESQVLELLQAFGKIRAFRLVKSDTDATESKGYCFCEYSDPSVTQIAIDGLHGMDIGAGKTLTCKLSADRGTEFPEYLISAAPVTTDTSSAQGMPPADRNIVMGYDIETLVDAAMGLVPMPIQPQYKDAFGLPLTRIVATVTPTMSKTRVLVLENMVTDDDLANDQDYTELIIEIREECEKFGKLVNMQVPRDADGESVKRSALRKVFLEYDTIKDAAAAYAELSGRKFGDNVVQISFFPEKDFSDNHLY